MNFDLWRHYARARLFQAFNKNQQAAEEYRLALRHDPQFARAASSLAFLCSKQGRFDEARQWFAEAVRIKPDDAVSHYNLGFLLDKTGHREEAVAAFRAAARLKPKFDQAWYGLGLSLAAQGRHDEAVAAFQEASLLNPMNAHAWYCLGMAHHHAHDPDKVKEVIEHLFRFDPVMTRQLIRDAERSDLAHMVKDLLV